MNTIAPIAPFVLAAMLPMVDALVVKPTPTPTPTLEPRGRANNRTYTSNGQVYTSRPGANSEGGGLQIWIYPLIAIAVIGVLIGFAMCFFRLCCKLAFSCCPSPRNNNKPVQQAKQIIVPVYEQPQAHNVPLPYTGGGYQTPYFNTQAEQYKAESYPLAYTPLSAKAPEAHSSRASLETQQGGNYQPTQHQYNPSQQFQGR